MTSVAVGQASLVFAAQEGEAYVPKQSDRAEALTGDEPGFQSIFNGRTLEGWQGDSKYWRAEDGDMVGEITPDTIVKSNTFLIWQGGEPGDFELKVDFRITAAGNSGINYRSLIVPDTVTPSNRYAMKGYQCDLDGQRRYTGNNYEEKGRLFLAERGQVTRVTGKRRPIILAALGDQRELGNSIRDDWNSVHLMARGNILMHYINGRVMSTVIDDDPTGRAIEGKIGVQVHVGPPMQVRYRNWRIKVSA